MLTKKQARAFFLAGTFGFSGIFVLLTVDTLARVPEQTRAEAMTDAVVRGKRLWDDNNCMGCHTLLGEGGYYAPELTKVFERRGAEWMRVFLKDPEAMFPGERKMVKYPFTEAQIDDLIAFFEWIGGVDTNGFPPKPNVNVGQPAVVKAETAGLPQPAKFAQICVACHSVGGTGGRVGPALDGVATRFDAAYLERWISDPQAVKPGTAMPKLPLSDAERGEIIAYLSTLK